MHLFSKQGPLYTRLDDGRSSGTKRTWLIAILGVALPLSFFLGRLSAVTVPAATQTDSALSFEASPHTFLYNRTFAESKESTDSAWDSLFPKQAGYFTHPTIAPRRATFSVFHYLHCLNGIRQAYWTAHDKASAGETLNDDTLPMMVSPPHVRHCIDLLRQALMCSPDLTVEVKDERVGGVHGFGETHQCVEWTELKDWVSRWEHKQ